MGISLERFMFERRAASAALFTSWGFDEARTAVLRNQLAYGVSRLVTLPIQRVINRFRRIWNLQPLAKLDDTFSPYAQICQQIAEFDFLDGFAGLLPLRRSNQFRRSERCAVPVGGAGREAYRVREPGDAAKPASGPLPAHP